MNKLAKLALASSLLFSYSALADIQDFEYATGANASVTGVKVQGNDFNNDFQCEVKGDSILSISHSENSVYFSFLDKNAGDDDESEDYAAFDIKKGAKQKLTIKGNTTFLTLMTKDDDNGKFKFEFAGSLSKQSSASLNIKRTDGANYDYKCIPDTIKVSKTFMEKGIESIK